MVQTSQMAGKNFYGQFERDRKRAFEDKSVFTTAELSYLEVTGTDGTSATMDETYKIDTNPIDPNSTPKTEKIDIRELPRTGGSK